MQNKDVKEAIIFIGNLEDFENIKSALKAGEELNYNKEDIMNYKVNSLFKNSYSFLYNIEFRYLNFFFISDISCAISHSECAVSSCLL